MRVLFWSEGFAPRIGGVEVLAARLVPALAERGHQFAVISRSDSDELADETTDAGIPIYRFPFWTALGNQDVDEVVRIRQRIATIKREFRADLVHVFAVGLDLMLHQLTARAHPSPVLVTLQSQRPPELFRPHTVLGSMLPRAAWVAACSSVVLAETRQRIPEITARSSVIWNCLDVPALNPEPLPISEPRLLCLGRLVKQKGFDLALAAFTLLRARYPGARLVIAGDGDERAQLELQALQLQIAESVDFLGWVAPADVPALLNGCTLVVMPSRQESFGLVALQAAQMARPIVATRVGGLPEVVVHGETGLLVDNDDSQALAAAVDSLLSHPEAAVQMGRLARDRALDLFGWKRFVDAYDGLYRRVAGQVEAANLC